MHGTVGAFKHPKHEEAIMSVVSPSTDWQCANSLIRRVFAVPEAAANILGKDDVVAPAVEIILKWRHNSAISPKTIADEMAIGRRTLERRFRDRLGTTVCKAILRIRLEIARDLIVRTDLLILHVSLEAGFSSPARMASVFREHFGCSPRIFRAQTHRTTNRKLTEPLDTAVFLAIADAQGVGN